METIVAPGGLTIRPARPGDEGAARVICLKTGDHGADAEALYPDDPDALARVYVEPYLAFEPELAVVVEDAGGVCGYALAALDSRAFYARYETHWRPALCARFPAPAGDESAWTPAQRVHHVYHHPEYVCPEPYERYPSHLHIDLLPRAQGRGCGRLMMTRVMGALRERGSAGVHLGVSTLNHRAQAFYRHLGFSALVQIGPGRDGCLYMGKVFDAR